MKVLNKIKKLFAKERVQTPRTIHARLSPKFDRWGVEMGLRPIRLKPVYESEINASLYFIYEDISQLPVSRYAILNEALEVLSHGIDRQYKKDLIQHLRNVQSSGDMGLLQSLIADLEARPHQTDTAALERIASALFVRHDENPYTWSESAAAKQQVDMEKDNQLRDFFLLTAKANLDAYQS